jgi:hypothetical protein
LQILLFRPARNNSDSSLLLTFVLIASPCPRVKGVFDHLLHYTVARRRLEGFSQQSTKVFGVPADPVDRHGIVVIPLLFGVHV